MEVEEWWLFIVSKLVALKKALTEWNWHIFGNIQKKYTSCYGGNT